MAVPFYLPNQDEQGASGSSGSSTGSSPNTTTSATQTPLPSPAPVNGEQLVQAFMEVLYRCSSSTSNGGSPGFQFPPPSPSCNLNSPGGFYSDEVFFPRNRSTPRSPRNSFHDEGAFFRHPIPTPSRSMRNGPPEAVSRRSRLTSTGDDDNEGHSEHETSWDELDERYEQYMAARERLQEFPGRIPNRKKRKEGKKTKEQSFTWPTVVTVFVFAVGCGFLVAR
ncbi:unnamed protein product [Hermetia illucens]|uniref:Uncharacterized protein n=1 Tax=Hermetia illucens TaxID=343691 RepID=A0A7R8ULN2_HERIL|nr:cell death protein hid [Hermetia illucens]CAD7082764.1 unnamed protein product [Hermetia illucens]